MSASVQPRHEVKVVHGEHDSFLLNNATGQCYVLNPVGTFIWRQLVAGRQRNDVVDAVVATWGIPEATAKQDVQSFLGELVKYLLAEERTP